MIEECFILRIEAADFSGMLVMKFQTRQSYIIKQEVLGRMNLLLSFDTKWTAWFLCCCMCIRFHGNVFTESWPSNRRGIYMQTHRLMEGFMKYAIEMGSGATIYVPGFMKIGSGIQKLIGVDTKTIW
jgi:hypothetical protein